jgi:hypothetical protein
MLGESARAATDPVHADPFPRASGAGNGCPGADERDLELVARGSADDPGQVGAPADELRVGRRPVGSAPGEQDDRLEQARLAGRVRAPDELRAVAERDIELGVTAEVAQRELCEGDPGRRRRYRGTGPGQEVVRTGMTTWV